MWHLSIEVNGIVTWRPFTMDHVRGLTVAYRIEGRLLDLIDICSGLKINVVFPAFLWLRFLSLNAVRIHWQFFRFHAWGRFPPSSRNHLLRFFSVSPFTLLGGRTFLVVLLAGLWEYRKVVIVLVRGYDHLDSFQQPLFIVWLHLRYGFDVKVGIRRRHFILEIWCNLLVIVFNLKQGSCVALLWFLSFWLLHSLGLIVGELAPAAVGAVQLRPEVVALFCAVVLVNVVFLQKFMFPVGKRALRSKGTLWHLPVSADFCLELSLEIWHGGDHLTWLNWNDV